MICHDQLYDYSVQRGAIVQPLHKYICIHRFLLSLHRIFIRCIICPHLANQSWFLFWRAHTEHHARTVSTIWCIERMYRQHIRASADPGDGLTRVNGCVFFLYVLVCLGAKVFCDACCGFVIPIRFDVVPCDWHELILSRADLANMITFLI